MRRVALAVAVLGFLCSLLAAQETPPPPKIADLGWFAGCWTAKFGEREILEQWMRPAGNALLGMSRTTSPKGMVEHEFLRIVADESGVLVLTAMPSGQSPASFRLKSSTPREVVFENLEHDFPQRIGYRSEAPDRLSAWIEGRRGERERRIDFPYERVSCE